MDVESRAGQEHLHHPLVDHVVGPLAVGRGNVELAAELGRLKVDALHAEELLDLVKEVVVAGSGVALGVGGVRLVVVVKGDHAAPAAVRP